ARPPACGPRRAGRRLGPGHRPPRRGPVRGVPSRGPQVPARREARAKRRRREDGRHLGPGQRQAPHGDREARPGGDRRHGRRHLRQPHCREDLRATAQGALMVDANAYIQRPLWARWLQRIIYVIAYGLFGVAGWAAVEALGFPAHEAGYVAIASSGLAIVGVLTHFYQLELIALWPLIS